MKETLKKILTAAIIVTVIAIVFTIATVPLMERGGEALGALHSGAYDMFGELHWLAGWYWFSLIGDGALTFTAIMLWVAFFCKKSEEKREEEYRRYNRW